jgi:UDPglucose 6-dehydrogenase
MRRSAAEAIGIIGAGVVGGALRRHLESIGYDVRVYDPPKGYRLMEPVNATNTVFVCVPTPYTDGRGFDDSHLNAAVASLTGSKTVVIKSTALPGTTELLQQRFPRHRFLFNPEFLREATAEEDFIHPDRQIVGCTHDSASDAWRVIAMLPRAPFERICAAHEAEMAKYMANAFLAVKVIFANEMFDLCERLRIPYDGVRDIVAADGRIGPSHLEVHDGGYRGFGGKCLPKDSKSLLDLARAAGVEMQVLGAADRVNNSMHRTAGTVHHLQLVPATPPRMLADERAA